LVVVQAEVRVVEVRADGRLRPVAAEVFLVEGEVLAEAGVVGAGEGDNEQ